MIKANNYITIQGWMRTELGLKGNDLMVYAIIYGFTQTEGQKFDGSLQYLADWCGCTKQGIQKNLKNLLDIGLIEKEDRYINNVKFVSYYTTQLHGVYNSVAQGIQLSCINNIDNKLEDNKKDTLVENFTKAYSETCISLPKIRTLTDKRKKAIQKLYKKYSEDDIMLVLEKTEKSDFLAGRAKDWHADLDWILNENNFIKILEGRYDNRNTERSRKFAERNVKSEQVTEEEYENGYFNGEII